jgi:hypothetical protein
MRREIVSFDKGTFDISLSEASPNIDVTICLQAGKIKVSAIACGCMLLTIISASYLRLLCNCCYFFPLT